MLGNNLVSYWTCIHISHALDGKYWLMNCMVCLFIHMVKIIKLKINSQGSAYHTVIIKGQNNKAHKKISQGHSKHTEYTMVQRKFWYRKTFKKLAKWTSFTNILTSQIPGSLKQLNVKCLNSPIFSSPKLWNSC